MPLFNQSVVGIFSREESSCYQWLVEEVQSVWGVKDVRPVLITNTWSHFQNHVPLCSFAILYHSKRRGRINVTDVTDSLYDDELQYLSQVLGKQRVIVVIDDLENTSEGEKARILNAQPSISSQASHLFLFSGEQGTNKEELRSFKILIASQEHRVVLPKCSIWLIFFAVVLLIVIIIVIVESSKHPAVENVTSPPAIVTSPPAIVTSTPENVTFTPETPNITQLSTLNPTSVSTMNNTASIATPGPGRNTTV